jgi:hypothetical protein
MRSAPNRALEFLLHPGSNRLAGPGSPASECATRNRVVTRTVPCRSRRTLFSSNTIPYASAYASRSLCTGYSPRPLKADVDVNAFAGKPGQVATHLMAEVGFDLQRRGRPCVCGSLTTGTPTADARTDTCTARLLAPQRAQDRNAVTRPRSGIVSQNGATLGSRSALARLSLVA